MHNQHNHHHNHNSHNHEHQEESEHKESKLTTGLKITVALITIIGMIFLSGIYQASLYSKTPESIDQKQIPSTINQETLRVPLTIFVIRDSDPLTSARDEDNIFGLVENAKNIWNQADISLWVKKIVSLRLTKTQIDLFFSSPHEFITTVEEYDPSTINMFLSRTLNGINGIAFIGTNSAAVADKTTVYDFRAFAHEVGHLLGLSHIKDRSRLMSQGVNGTKLTKEEITRARDFAKTF
jgi:hypothetical protein